MGSGAPRPSNGVMIDELVKLTLINSERVEGAFRAVDRGMYFDLSSSDDFDPYSDSPWRQGNIHISAPCIYARVVEALDLKPGLSFLNLGSGTGYLNTIIGLLVGPSGLNHGVELHEDVVEYARRKLKQFKAISYAIDKYDFSEPHFAVGNCLNLDPCSRYDRIYLGAACLPDQEGFMKKLLKPNGGILVMPYRDRLMRYVRVSETEWRRNDLMTVNFTSMVRNASFDPEGIGPTRESEKFIKMPPINPKSLKELCRIVIRQRLRDTINAIKPKLMNSSNLEPRRMKWAKAERNIREKLKKEHLKSMRSRWRREQEKRASKKEPNSSRDDDKKPYLEKHRLRGSCGSSMSEASSSRNQVTLNNSKSKPIENRSGEQESPGRMVTRSTSAKVRNNQLQASSSGEAGCRYVPRSERANSSSAALDEYQGDSRALKHRAGSLNRHNRNNYRRTDDNEDDDNDTAATGASLGASGVAINLSAQTKQHCARTRPFVWKSNTRRSSQRVLHMRAKVEASQEAPVSTSHRVGESRASSPSVSESTREEANSDSSLCYSEPEESQISSDSSDSSDSGREDHYLPSQLERSLFRFLQDSSLPSRMHSSYGWLRRPPDLLASYLSPSSEDEEISLSSSSMSQPRRLDAEPDESIVSEFLEISHDSSGTPLVEDIDSLFDSNLFDSDEELSSDEQVAERQASRYHTPNESPVGGSPNRSEQANLDPRSSSSREPDQPVASSSRQRSEEHNDRNCRHLVDCVCERFCWRNRRRYEPLTQSSSTPGQSRIQTSGSGNTCVQGHSRPSVGQPREANRRRSTHRFASSSRGAPSSDPLLDYLDRMAGPNRLSLAKGKRKRRGTSSSSDSSEDSEPTTSFTWLGRALSSPLGTRPQARRSRFRSDQARAGGQLCGECSSERAQERQLRSRNWHNLRPDLDSFSPARRLPSGSALPDGQVPSAVEDPFRGARSRVRTLMERQEGQPPGRKRLRGSPEQDKQQLKSRGRRAKRPKRSELRRYYEYMRAAIQELDLPRCLHSYLNYDEN